jgi:hypothetical protein
MVEHPMRRRLFLFLALLLVTYVLPGRLSARAVSPHDRGVPILTYHLVSTPPAGAAFPDLYVSPEAFAAQMEWLAQHGYHAVTLRRAFDYWTTGDRIRVDGSDGLLGFAAKLTALAPS